MANRTHQDRRHAGEDVLHTMRGGRVAGADAAAAIEARLGPLGSYVVDFALGDIWSRPGLSRRDRSLVVITILATLNQLNQLHSHVQNGINHGLSREEIDEIFVQLAGYAGFPRAIDATTTAHAAIAALQKVDQLEARPPAPAKDDAQRSADAKEVMRRLSADPRLDEYVLEFLPQPRRREEPGS